MSDGVLSRRVLDVLYVLVVLMFFVMCTTVVIVTFRTANKVAELNQIQVEFAIQQNERAIQQGSQALCNQHDMLLGLKNIKAELGLRTDNIIIPDITGLDCG